MIPHRRRRDALLRALAAVDGWRVLVVDDTDDGLDLDVPRVRLGGGSGFARAANTGIAAANTAWVVVLNDDAAPIDDALDRLARAAGPSGPVLVGPRGVESAGIHVESWGRVWTDTSLPASDRRVAALCGACLRVPASARFDERFRHGFEDVDLVRRLGGGTVVAGATCWHEGGGTVARTSAFAQRGATGGQLRLYPTGWRDPVIVALGLAQVARERGDARRAAAVFRGWADARLGAVQNSFAAAARFGF